MTCRQAILSAARTLAASSPDGSFSAAQVIAEMRRRGSRYPDTTIRTHVVAAMCINAPDNHAVKYPDLIRVSHGRYTLADHTPTPAGDNTATLLPADTAAEPLDPGESSTQREAESVILQELSHRLGITLQPRRIHLSDGAWVDVDGFYADPLVLVEAWAHQGPHKAAQTQQGAR